MTQTHRTAPVPPIVVRRPLGTGGRRVTAHGRILGLAHSDADVVALLRGAELPDAELLLDDGSFMAWQGGHAHHYEAA
ncbi:hypothetical protein [Streptomyces sp. NPDC049813]|uniref:hypothetical protein n=1 Tax=Streptomyces sp. NPDC049813 TaxID=3365597 RepID=UPI0037A022C9